MLGGGNYPGHDHGDDRHGAAARGRRQLDRDRAPPAALRGVVRGPLARLRRHRARVVPPDPDRQRARARPPRRRLLARALPRHARVLIVFRVLVPLAQRVPLPAARRRGDRRRARASSRCESAAAGSNGSRAQPGQFFLWRFLDRRRWWTAHPFSLSAAPDGRRRCGSRSRRSATTRARIGSLAAGHARRRRGAVRHLHRGDRAAADKALLIAGGIGITPIRALLETMRGDLVVVYRVVDDERRRSSATSSTSSPRERGATLHHVVGDHTRRGREPALAGAPAASSSPTSPSARSILCGPPAMTEAIAANVRAADVPRRQIHTERFALT